MRKQTLTSRRRCDRAAPVAAAGRTVGRPTETDDQCRQLCVRFSQCPDQTRARRALATLRTVRRADHGGTTRIPPRVARLLRHQNGVDYVDLAVVGRDVGLRHCCLVHLHSRTRGVDGECLAFDRLRVELLPGEFG